jgi:hypothetical protein
MDRKQTHLQSSMARRHSISEQIPHATASLPSPSDAAATNGNTARIKAAMSVAPQIELTPSVPVISRTNPISYLESRGHGVLRVSVGQTRRWQSYHHHTTPLTTRQREGVNCAQHLRVTLQSMGRELCLDLVHQFPQTKLVWERCDTTPALVLVVHVAKPPRAANAALQWVDGGGPEVSRNGATFTRTICDANSLPDDRRGPGDGRGLRPGDLTCGRVDVTSALRFGMTVWHAAHSR